MRNKGRVSRAIKLFIPWFSVLMAVHPIASAYSHSEPSSSSRVERPSNGFGGPFSLISHEGKRVSNDDFRGKIMIVYFGYTFCPDTCPVDAQNIGDSLSLLGDQANSVQPIFITIDPERDTPSRLAKWLGAIHPGFVGLTGTVHEIVSVANSYKVIFSRLDKPGGYEFTFTHPGLIYVMDVDGHFLFLLPPGSPPKVIGEEIRKLLSVSK